LGNTIVSLLLPLYLHAFYPVPYYGASSSEVHHNDATSIRHNSTFPKSLENGAESGTLAMETALSY